MRISDWSSDVCSSDLSRRARRRLAGPGIMITRLADHKQNVFRDDALDRDLAEGLFDALRDKTSDGVGIAREAYSERESLALDIVETKARALGLATERDMGAKLEIGRAHV